MAQIDLGKLKFNWRGDWATATAYEVDDVVYYNGSAYVVVQALTTSQNIVPAQDAKWPSL